ELLSGAGRGAASRSAPRQRAHRLWWLHDPERRGRARRLASQDARRPLDRRADVAHHVRGEHRRSPHALDERPLAVEHAPRGESSAGRWSEPPAAVHRVLQPSELRRADRVSDLAGRGEASARALRRIPRHEIREDRLHGIGGALMLYRGMDRATLDAAYNNTAALG